MAAADISGSLAGVRSTKRLLLVFTLLSLVYAAHSLEAKEHLEILTKYHQGGMKAAAKKKAQLGNELNRYADSFEKQIQNLDPFVKYLKAMTEKSYYLRDLTTVINDFFDKKRETMAGVIELYKKEMEDIWAFIELQEDKQDEL
ncbi:hypothetical protein ILYODFUR_037592 [Ilyodon furcidens]|uniref:Uncharacterized protein n=1 Tax=Ilyodon furcidens TaxID=33524 RepID=A0ABV0UNQ9_9TELE